MRTVEAEIDIYGNVKLREVMTLTSPRCALVTVLEEGPSPHLNESVLLSEAVLGADWNRPEEESAWSHLQPEP